MRKHVHTISSGVGDGNVVRTVVAHWIEGGSWWRRPERSGERQLWRVEAECHRSTALGVYDLSCDPMVSQWHLVRALD